MESTLDPLTRGGRTACLTASGPERGGETRDVRTHSVSFDAPERNGRVLADCSEYIPFALISDQPTCPRCRMELAKTIDDMF